MKLSKEQLEIEQARQDALAWMARREGERAAEDWASLCAQAWGEPEGVGREAIADLICASSRGDLSKEAAGSLVALGAKPKLDALRLSAKLRRESLAALGRAASDSEMGQALSLLAGEGDWGAVDFWGGRIGMTWLMRLRIKAREQGRAAREREMERRMQESLSRGGAEDCAGWLRTFFSKAEPLSLEILGKAAMDADGWGELWTRAGGQDWVEGMEAVEARCPPAPAWGLAWSAWAKEGRAAPMARALALTRLRRAPVQELKAAARKGHAAVVAILAPLCPEAALLRAEADAKGPALAFLRSLRERREIGEALAGGEGEAGGSGRGEGARESGGRARGARRL